jgi:alcohol dehydrogenase class IV
MAFMEPRAPDAIASLAAAIRCEPGEIERRILALGGDPPGLGAAGADHAKLDEALDEMLQRPELGFNPQPPTRAELAEVIERAW